MRIMIVNRSTFFLVLACFAYVFLGGGCGDKKAPPAAPAPEVTTNVSSPVAFTFLRWKEGLKMLLVFDHPLDPGKGHSVVSDRKSPAGHPIHIERGTAFLGEGLNYAWEVETPDGRTGKLSIDGIEYDLAKGHFILLKGKGEQAQVLQLNRDLSDIPFDSADCRVYLEKDADVKKFMPVGK